MSKLKAFGRSMSSMAVMNGALFIGAIQGVVMVRPFAIFKKKSTPFLDVFLNI